MDRWNDANRLLEAILAISTDAIFVKDLDGKIILANRAAEKLFGLRNGGLVGIREAELVPDALIERLSTVDRKVARGEATTETYEIPTDAGVRVYSCSKQPLRDSDGTVHAILACVKDITSERRAHDVLALSDGRFRLAALSSADILYDYDVANNSIWWSASLHAVLGFPEESERTPLEWWADHIHDEDRERVLNSLDAALAGSDSFWSERYRMQRADGSWAHLHDRGYFIRDASSTAVRMIGAMIDLSDAEYAFSALAFEQNRYRSLIQNADEVIFDLDIDGRIRDVNPAFEKHSGFKRHEVVGLPFFEFLDESEYEKAMEGLKRNLNEPARGHQGVLRVKKKDGSWFLLEGTSTAQLVDGKPTGIFGIGRNVTERVRAAEERERLTRYLRLLLESTTEGIYGLDSDGRCTFVNQSAEDLLGFREEELLGAEMHELVHHSRTDGSPYPLNECPMTRASIDGAVIRGEEVFWTKERKPIAIEYSVSPIVENDRHVGAVVVFAGIDQRKLMERQLEQAKRLSSLGRLAATVAHEFNNVLMSIQPSAEVIMRLAGAEQRIASLASNIEQAVRRGRRITHEILRYTQPAKPSLSSIDLSRWLPPFLDEMRKMLGHEFELSVRFDDESLAIAADPAQLHQVMTNLVLNARDAIGELGGKIEVTVSPAASRVLPLKDQREHAPGEYVCLSVGDDGPGIPAEFVGEIFEPLFTTKRSGTGLGLAVVHQIVSEHGGQITARNSEQGGAVFELLLPRAREAFAVEETAATSAIGFSRVLLVEDDLTVATGMRALLELEGARVTHVAQGAAAITALETVDVDLVILDVGLPDVDGTVVYERIAHRRPDLPVIFSTGHSGRSRLENYLRSPNVGFLQKPYDFQALVKVCSDLRARLQA